MAISDSKFTMSKKEHLDNKEHLRELAFLLEEELVQLAIHEAKKDFSENEEYKISKSKIADIHSDIRGLQYKLDNCILVTENSNRAKNVVEHGMLVRLTVYGVDPDTGEDVQKNGRLDNNFFRVFDVRLAQDGSDPLQGLLPQHSPIYEAIIGLTSGSIIPVTVGPVSRNIKVEVL